MITGSHSIIYSKDAGADRKFFKDILKFANVDVGDGWLIFGLPPSEIAFHPHDENDLHEFYLITDDINAFIDAMKNNLIECSAPSNQGWGIMTSLSLPGGGKLGVYEPRHKRPAAPKAVSKSKPKKKSKPAKKVAKKVVKKAAKKKVVVKKKSKLKKKK